MRDTGEAALDFDFDTPRIQAGRATRIKVIAGGRRSPQRRHARGMGLVAAGMSATT